MRFRPIRNPIRGKESGAITPGSGREEIWNKAVRAACADPRRPARVLLRERRRRMRDTRMRIEICAALTTRLPSSRDPPHPQIRREDPADSPLHARARRDAVGACQVKFDRELTETNADNVGTMATATNRRKSASRNRRGASRSMSTSSKRRLGRRTSAQRKSSSRTMSGRVNRGIGGARRRSMRTSRRSRMATKR